MVEVQALLYGRQIARSSPSDRRLFKSCPVWFGSEERVVLVAAGRAVGVMGSWDKIARVLGGHDVGHVRPEAL